jgi:hypothetical protein
MMEPHAVVGREESALGISAGWVDHGPSVECHPARGQRRGQNRPAAQPAASRTRVRWLPRWSAPSSWVSRLAIEPERAVKALRRSLAPASQVANLAQRASPPHPTEDSDQALVAAVEELLQPPSPQ